MTSSFGTGLASSLGSNRCKDQWNQVEKPIFLQTELAASDSARASNHDAGLDHFGFSYCCDHGSRHRHRYEHCNGCGTYCTVNCLEGHLVIERLLEPGSTELPICRCGIEMKLVAGDRPPTTYETEIRIFRCSSCEHEMRLTVWSGFDGEL